MSADGCGVKVPAHERVVLANGLTLIVVPRPDVPLIAFNAVMRGGASCDPDDYPGVATLVAGLLEKGAGKRDAFAFADVVEGAGGSFHCGAGPESISVRGQFLARDQQLLLELLADCLQRPRLARAEFEILRSRQIELIKALKDSDPAELLGTYGRALLFAGHPFGRPVCGSEGSLARISHEQVLDYHRLHFGADRLTLIVAGDVDPGSLKQTVGRVFADWRPGNCPVPRLPRPARLRERRVLLIDSPGSAQSYFWIGNVGIDQYYPERAAVDLVNALYGGRFTSLLNTELRVKSGLSYGARSGFTRGSVPGEFSIRSFAQTGDTGRAIDLSLQTLRQLQRLTVSREMLQSARAYVLGQFPLEFETAADWAAALGETELFGLGADSIGDYARQLCDVTLEQLPHVIADAFPSPEAVGIVLIGDRTRILGQVEAYGPITHLPLTRTEFSVDAPREANSVAALSHA